MQRSDFLRACAWASASVSLADPALKLLHNDHAGSPYPRDRHPECAALRARRCALWVWRFRSADMLVDLAEAVEARDLMIWVAPGFRGDASLMQRLTRLRALADSHRLTLKALCGDPSWAEAAQVVARWAREVRSLEMFASVHLDVEPNALPHWKSDRNRLAAGLLRALERAHASQLPVEADVPAWFDRVLLAGRRLDTQILEVVAGVTIMAYHDTSQAIIHAASPGADEADRMGKYFQIGINLAPTNGDAPNTTLLGQPATVIAQTVATVSGRASSSWRNFHGAALHDAEYVSKVHTALSTTRPGQQCGWR